MAFSSGIVAFPDKNSPLPVGEGSGVKVCLLKPSPFDQDERRPDSGIAELFVFVPDEGKPCFPVTVHTPSRIAPDFPGIAGF
jgi:hypothetical protein